MPLITIKRLSLHEPFASQLAVTGEKTIETRVWGTSYRGDILVCSTLSSRGELAGHALGIVEVYDVRDMTAKDETAACVQLYPRAKAWLTRNRRTLLKPFPIKGGLSLRDVQIPSELLVFRND